MTTTTSAATPYEHNATLPYAAVSPPRTGNPWAGAAIIAGGLGLILLGGCFLIGLMVIVGPDTLQGTQTPLTPITMPAVVLMICLYVLAFACFGGAAFMLYIGTRALLKLMRT